MNLDLIEEGCRGLCVVPECWLNDRLIAARDEAFKILREHGRLPRQKRPKLRLIQGGEDHG